MIFEKIIAGDTSTVAYKAITEMMKDFDTDKAYADMIRLRISGEIADKATDIYYVAHENGKALSRHWCGYGNHKDAIGNWGNFYTAEECRGQGIGGKLLKMWFEDFNNAKELPLCFCCSANRDLTVNVYSRFGFRPALDGAECGPLYLPCKGSPETFREFADNYYKPSDVIIHKPVDVGYRHEIDCLLRFYFYNNKLDFGFGEMDYLEKGYLYAPQKTGMLFSQDGHCVGWSYDGKIQIHPLYEKSEIIKEW